MFRRSRSSAVRYCQSAVELPYGSIWGTHGVKLAIAQVSRYVRSGNLSGRSASAIGVVHCIHGRGHPLLPVEVEFDFADLDEKFNGRGEVYLLDRRGDTYFYQARIFISDPGGIIYTAFERAIEHAAISANQFVHLTLTRDREIASDFNGVTSLQEGMKRVAKLRELMCQVDAGTASLPDITFSGVSFEDVIYTKGPLWASSWLDSLGLLKRSFLDPETAKWRNVHSSSLS